MILAGDISMESGDRGIPLTGGSSSNAPMLLRPAQQAKLPPHPLDKQWYVHVDGEQYGPYTGHEIKRMAEQDRIKPTDHLCPVGGSQWSVAKEESVLGGLFSSIAKQRTEEERSAPINGNTGTVVQVTNHIPNPLQAALLLELDTSRPKSPGLGRVDKFDPVTRGCDV